MKPFLFSILICISNILSGQETLEEFLINKSYDDFNIFYDLETETEMTSLYWYYKGRIDLYNECFEFIND